MLTLVVFRLSNGCGRVGRSEDEGKENMDGSVKDQDISAFRPG
jgi:hypothetical protein